MSEQEKKEFADLWKNPSQARKNGFSLLGKKFACKTIDDERLTGAGKDGGVVAYKSDEAITLGVMPEGRPFGLATIQIVGLGEYFKEKGY
ncbi:MAG: hypothetical protein Q9190_004754 [Brigantiaea leucoxantha]